MAKPKRPSVSTRCVADYHATSGERIVEFVFPSGHGGLISLRTFADGREVVEIYRVDPEITVRHHNERKG